VRGLITAIRTLTLVPAPGRDTEDLARALPYFPLVGAAIGAAVACAARAVAGGLEWTSGAGAIGVGLSTLLTGGLHLDGLGDVFDSFGGRSRERKLEIMKDPRMGSFGVIAIVTCLLLKLVSLARLSGGAHPWRMVLPYALSRTVLVPLAVWLPYARAEGGSAAPFVQGARTWHLFPALLAGAAVSIIVAQWFGLLAFVAGLGLTGALGLWMKRAFGGVTGDLLGMTIETIETLTLLALALSM
jgi:adenosylcobinamide-GDP ribazoletransferase